jgi:hypothetical protein
MQVEVLRSLNHDSWPVLHPVSPCSQSMAAVGESDPALLVTVHPVPTDEGGRWWMDIVNISDEDRLKAISISSGILYHMEKISARISLPRIFQTALTRILISNHHPPDHVPLHDNQMPRTLTYDSASFYFGNESSSSGSGNLKSNVDKAEHDIIFQAPSWTMRRTKMIHGRQICHNVSWWWVEIISIWCPWLGGRHENLDQFLYRGSLCLMMAVEEDV